MQVFIKDGQVMANIEGHMIQLPALPYVSRLNKPIAATLLLQANGKHGYVTLQRFQSYGEQYFLVKSKAVLFDKSGKEITSFVAKYMDEAWTEVQYKGDYCNFNNGDPYLFPVRVFQGDTPVLYDQKGGYVDILYEVSGLGQQGESVTLEDFGVTIEVEQVSNDGGKTYKVTGEHFFRPALWVESSSHVVGVRYTVGADGTWTSSPVMTHVKKKNAKRKK